MNGNKLLFLSIMMLLLTLGCSSTKSKSEPDYRYQGNSYRNKALEEKYQRCMTYSRYKEKCEKFRDLQY